MGGTLHACAWKALAASSVSVTPASAEDEPRLCRELGALADASRDGRTHQVRIVFTGGDDERARCTGSGKVERKFCRWFSAHPENAHFVSMTQKALTCLERDPQPPQDDPDVIVLHAWWSRGTFDAESGPLSRDPVSFVMDMDLTARKVRGG
jgi:hypothetical protein